MCLRGRMKNFIFLLLSLVLVAGCFPLSALAGTAIRVMLLDGESGGPYHK
jgi:hypothetical protein